MRNIFFILVACLLPAPSHAGPTGANCGLNYVGFAEEVGRYEWVQLKDGRIGKLLKDEPSEDGKVVVLVRPLRNRSQRPQRSDLNRIRESVDEKSLSLAADSYPIDLKKFRYAAKKRTDLTEVENVMAPDGRVGEILKVFENGMVEVDFTTGKTQYAALQTEIFPASKLSPEAKRIKIPKEKFGKELFLESGSRVALKDGRPAEILSVYPDGKLIVEVVNKKQPMGLRSRWVTEVSSVDEISVPVKSLEVDDAVFPYLPKKGAVLRAGNRVGYNGQIVEIARTFSDGTAEIRMHLGPSQFPERSRKIVAQEKLAPTIKKIELEKDSFPGVDAPITIRPGNYVKFKNDIAKVEGIFADGNLHLKILAKGRFGSGWRLETVPLKDVVPEVDSYGQIESDMFARLKNGDPASISHVFADGTAAVGGGKQGRLRIVKTSSIELAP